MEREFRVLVHHEEGSFWAEVPELPGLFVAGDSIEELREALAEALSLYLSDGGETVDVSPISWEREEVTEAFDAKVLVG